MRGRSAPDSRVPTRDSIAEIDSGSRSWSGMAFKVGDRVVYPHHGAAVIERKEVREAFGEMTEYLVLRVPNGDLTLAVPSNKAEDVGMRPPISVEDIDDLFQLLGEQDMRCPTNWQRALNI